MLKHNFIFLMKLRSIVFVGNLDWYDIWDIIADTDPLVHRLQYQLEQRGKVLMFFPTIKFN